MSNPILQYLKSKIGSPITDTPSHVTKWLDGKLLSAEEGNVIMEFKVRDEMLNPALTLHGGVAALIMDDIIGLSVFSLYNEYFYTSINLAIDFLKTAKLDECIKAHAEVVRKGRNVVNVKCTIYNCDDMILARGMSNLITTKNRNPFYQSGS
jgi:uncharacterized protein (TIGR00369 family)